MTQSPETDASLILRLHDRADQQAWCEFVEIYQPVVYRLARYKGLQHADAEDIVQQVLAAVAGAVGRWQPDKSRGRFRTWLQTIARNQITNALSRQAADRASGETGEREILAQQPAAESADSRLLITECRREIFQWAAPTDDPRMLGRVGPYEIAGVIGAGGMGIVLKGFDAALNRYVAIKLLAPRLAASAMARRRFAREAQAAAAVMHDNVMAIHSVAESQGLPYFVMPYARGASLEKHILRTGPLGTEEILRIGMQAAAGLSAAHAQGLVHRDIKPANILLEEGTERVKITDFGLARAADDASLTRSGVIAGTPQYMSPEQARGEAVDHRTDLFSLGSVLYAMATGRPPFRADTPYGMLRRICESEARPVIEINPSAPFWLGRIIGRLHEKEPARRFESAAEVAALLEQCLAHVQQPSSIPLPDVLIDPSRRAKARRRWMIGGVSIGTVVAVVAVLVFAGRTREHADTPSAADRRRVGIAHHEPTADLVQDKNVDAASDALATQLDRASEAAHRLESDVVESLALDELIEHEMDYVDRGLSSLEAEVLESLGANGNESESL